MEFFRTPRPAAGNCTFRLQLGPLAIEISGLDAPLRDLLVEKFAPYSTGEAVPGNALRVVMGLEDADYFIEPPQTSELVQVLIACDTDRVRYLSYRAAGWFEMTRGSGLLLLSRGEWEPVERSVENFIRAAVAWLAACSGGALVHAAGAVWDSKGYIFYGESGAGKSTLSASNQRASIVSDDLSLILPGQDGSLELIGSPFRGTYTEGAPVVGRFPLAAGFRLVKSDEVAVKPVARIRALSELVGNLPFVAEAFGTRPDLLDQVERVFGDIPLHHLHFRKDDTYWDVIRSAGL